MVRRNGRSYVVRGEAPKRYWEPSQGDVVYIEGTTTKLGKPYQEPGGRDVMFPLRPPVRGTTDMSARNIKAIARVEAGKGMESVGSTARFSYRSQPNPAGPSAIPTKWTPATVSRKGRQIQIRVGGR
jgi:hypothetical protein